MRLRQPDIAKAVTTVEKVKSELNNAATRGTSAEVRAADFLTWCESWARPQLGNHFPDTEPLFEEIAQSHRRMALRPSMDTRTLNGLINEECKTWTATLDRLIAELQALQPFMTRLGTPLVVDTSALMEGMPFRAFPWPATVPEIAAEVPGPHVRLIIPILVVEELDELMHHRDADRPPEIAVAEPGTTGEEADSYVRVAQRPLLAIPPGEDHYVGLCWDSSTATVKYTGDLGSDVAKALSSFRASLREGLQ
jgi:hypothetical protein